MTSVVVTGDQMAALRAYLADDRGQHKRLIERLGDSGVLGYQLLALGALAVAARREFSPGSASADVVRFVAWVRINLLPDDLGDLDPVAAEAVLRFALGEDVPLPMDPETCFRATILLLGILAYDEHPDDAALDGLLAEARSLAEGWLAERS